MAQLRFDIREGDIRRFEQATEKNVQDFVDELGRSFLRGSQRESNWPVLTGASRRGFYIEQTGSGFEVRNREEYARYVEEGVRRSDGGGFIRRWFENNRDSILSDALDRAFEDSDGR